MPQATESSLEADGQNYRGLDFDRAELSAVMQETYDEIIAFVTTPEFKAIRDELMSLPPADRPGFVMSVVMNPDELARRGVVAPEGILIQTSGFGDRRPTLFAVKKFLPDKYHGAWENVNLTFGNEFDDDEISRDPEDAWRPPLPVALQNALLAGNVDLEAVPTKYGVNFGAFEPAHAAEEPGGQH